MSMPLPLLSLAPMQDVTDLAFMRAIHDFGGADLYTTPYFRVVSHTDHLDEDLLMIITENPSDSPVFAQIIGSDPEALCRAANILQQLPIGGIDLNLGCPAPVVCRKNAGGGALRHPQKLDRALGGLRDACKGKFSIKTRLGYDSVDEFEDLLPLYKKHCPDLLTIHARTVKEGYHAPVHPEYVRQAVDYMPCPVVANGNIVDVDTAFSWMEQARPHGLMIGRGAVRNPWIFQQIRQRMSDSPIYYPTHKDVRGYINRLFEETARLMFLYEEIKHIHRMKKFMVYILQGLPAEFEYHIRRCASAARFHQLCDEYLDSDSPVPLRPSGNTKLFRCFEQLLDPSGSSPCP